MSSDVYLITLVFHEHSRSLDDAISAYSSRLSERCLPDVPFHMVDLIHGHGDYEGMDPAQRKPMLYAFATFVRTLPITYVALRFGASDTGGRSGLEARIRKGVSDFIFERLERFQKYDEAAVYYDGAAPSSARQCVPHSTSRSRGTSRATASRSIPSAGSCGRRTTSPP